MSQGAAKIVISTRFDAFKTWLGQRGSELLATTNPYEVLRFTTPEGTAVIYRNGKGEISDIHGAAMQAINEFCKPNSSWRCTPAVKRDRGSPTKRRTAANLVARDGAFCWLCGSAFSAPAEISVDHLVPLTQGAPDTLANKALAHERCNTRAGAMTLREKIELAVRQRSNCSGGELMDGAA